MREIKQTSTKIKEGEVKNDPIWVYDTSGFYTDPEVEINLYKGLDPLRMNWIKERGDTEKLSNRTSFFAKKVKQWCLPILALLLALRIKPESSRYQRHSSNLFSNMKQLFKGFPRIKAI